jgi:hypothetical protein
MAKENPTGRGAAVALSIPADQVCFLRDLFQRARAGVREELREHPDGGHENLPIGGHRISPLADAKPPQWRPSDLPIEN